MARGVRKPKSDLNIIQLLPNLLTVTSLCAGLTSIRFGIQGQFKLAILMILVAAVLDGLDGRLARLLRSDSKMGAELDSLADFLNFGVAPPILIYLWALQDLRRIGWIATLVFAVSCVLRLARFNVSNKSEDTTADKNMFTGVPSPAGALLVMFPMYLSFAIGDEPVLPAVVICAYMLGIGFLMISQIPTPAFKSMTISRPRVPFFLVGFAFVCAALLTYVWLSLIVVSLVYAGAIIWTLREHRKTA